MRNRYFHDEEAEAIFYVFNGTETPTGREDFSMTRLKILFDVHGSQSAPVRNLQIRGLTIRDAALTYLGTTEADRHELPSTGDWALARSGAVRLEGVENVTLARNHFTRCDGNAISLNNFARGVAFVGNDFRSDFNST